MLTEADRIKLLTQQIRMEVGAVYVLARTPDPALKPRHTRHLVSIMETAMKRTGEYAESKSILDECSKLCMDATILYKQSKWDASIELCEHVLDEITPYIHAGYGKMQDSVFTLPSGEVK